MRTPVIGVRAIPANSDGDRQLATGDDPRTAFSIIKRVELALPKPARQGLRRALAVSAGIMAVAVVTLALLLWRGGV